MPSHPECAKPRLRPTACWTLLLIATLAGNCGWQNVQAQTAPYKPKDPGLYDTISRLDGLMFDAFNRHDLPALQKLFSENVEFYNDGGGVSSYQATIDNFKKLFARNADTGLRRELVKGSLEVYPLPDFGAIEMGTHRFIHTENGKEEVGTMKFVQVWQLKNGEWKATRVISVGH